LEGLRLKEQATLISSTARKRRLNSTIATISVILDGKPLYEWTGPTGALNLGTMAKGWAVSAVKLKRSAGK